MNGSWSDFLWILAAVGLITWLTSILAVDAICRVIRNRGIIPAAASHALTLTPWLGPLLSIGAVVVLSASKRLGLITDHCLHHPGIQHLHFCLEHLPVFSPSVAVKAAVSGAVGWFLWQATRIIRNERYLTSQLTQICQVTGKTGPVLRSDHSNILAFTGSIGRPLIVLSGKLFPQLSPRQRRIVLAHEVAHIRHRDSLRAVLMAILLSAHLPTSRQVLTQAWSVTRELQVDRKIAQRFGKLAVAETLVRAAYLSAPFTSRTAWAIAGSDVALRVRQLLDSPMQVNKAAVLLASAALLASFTAPAMLVKHHHIVETMLNSLNAG